MGCTNVESSWKDTLVVLTVLVIFVFLLYFFMQWTDTFEASIPAYQQIATMKKNYPEMQPDISKAMSRGYLSKGDYYQLCAREQEIIKERVEQELIPKRQGATK